MRPLEAGAAVAVVGIAAWVVATALPAWSQVAWTGAVLLLLALALVALTGRAFGLRQPRVTPFQSLLQQPKPRPVRPADLERIERLTGWVAYSRHDFNHRLRPLFTALIRRRLEMSRGIRLPEDSPIPVELLSPELGALMTPSDAIPRSITTRDLNRALDDIEEL
jgi:hypothetical protein